MVRMRMILAVIVMAAGGAAAQTNGEWTANRLPGTNRVWTAERTSNEIVQATGQLGPRIAALESGTNGWNAAYAWGNHAAAGYLLSSAWNTWLSTNTYVKTELDQTALAALAAFAETNKTKVVYSAVSSNVWATLGVGGTVTVHTVVSYIVPDPDNIVVDDPHDFFDGTYQNQGGGVYWFNADFSYIYISATAATLYTIGDTAAYGGDGTVAPFEFQEALNGFPLPVPTTSFALKAGYVTNSVPYVLTTGNVWQAVGEAKDAAEAAQLAADQAGTLINYHTDLDAAPHAGKFLTPGQLTNNTSHVMAQWYAADGSLTQQIMRAGTEIWTNRWPAGLAGAITNGMVGPLTVGGVKLDTNKIEFTNDDGSTAVYQSGGSLVFRAILGQRIYFFNGSGAITGWVDPIGFQLDDNKCLILGGDGDASLCFNGTDLVANPRRLASSADFSLASGSFKFGPAIEGKQAHLFSNGTNLYFVNINYVTNAITTN